MKDYISIFNDIVADDSLKDYEVIEKAKEIIAEMQKELKARE